MLLPLKAVYNAYLKLIGDGLRSYCIDVKFSDFKYFKHETETRIPRHPIGSIRGSNWCYDCDVHGRLKCQQLQENMKKLNYQVARS